MPTYSYKCTECENAFDVQQSFTDDSLTICPVCDGPLRKVFNSIGVTFNGSGFYRTDSRAGNGKGRGKEHGKEHGGRSKEPAAKASDSASSGSASSSSGSSASSSSGSSSSASSSSASPSTSSSAAK